MPAYARSTTRDAVGEAFDRVGAPRERHISAVCVERSSCPQPQAPASPATSTLPASRTRRSIAVAPHRNRGRRLFCVDDCPTTAGTRGRFRPATPPGIGAGILPRPSGYRMQGGRCSFHRSTCNVFHVVRQGRPAQSGAARDPRYSKYVFSLVTALRRLPAQKLIMIESHRARSSPHSIQRDRHLLHWQTTQSRLPPWRSLPFLWQGLPKHKARLTFVAFALGCRHNTRYHSQQIRRLFVPL